MSMRAMGSQVPEHPLDRVLDGRMCAGCGACAYLADEVEMVDLPHIGRRPVGVRALPIMVKDQIYSVCPGAAVRSPGEKVAPSNSAELLVGPVKEVWEGWASDAETRRGASSGGIISALATYCVEQLGMRLVVHTGMEKAEPWTNSTVVSSDRAGILGNSGSRYAPSSPVEALREIEASDRPCVFIGKPCDVAAVRELRRTRPQLDRNLGLVLSFFCAGTPASAGTLHVAEHLGFHDPSSIESIKYRGDGWPGRFRVRDSAGEHGSLSYEESWGMLARQHRQLRCHMCPDGLGELSDITGGDAWHRKAEGGDGVSLVLARTELGRRTVLQAEAAGYLTLAPSDVQKVVDAQGLVARRELITPRLAALRLMGLPVPSYPGFRLWRASLSIGPLKFVREFLGTLSRAVMRGYRRPEQEEEKEAQ
ncbi:coenzyme F420 hydrogenase [Tessaracoccus rhinocerotis]|uniref:Coenzyme F420 hydrogenase n=1 Tax=Tessaracoccus rhinocerotis TaxID=1689449 RepID=A0A553K1P2_9ACTN|nr:Coenzyme F420 hydrogenase/dehydrogenase, beta subunit C-terminal domain [Tessaracoccus rhinocerotis]TRY18627.1 coenzyme F420 hydrogenase [Tessaracoccus rhinocerotis]